LAVEADLSRRIDWAIYLDNFTIRR